MDRQVPLAICKLAQLGGALGVTKITELPGCWEHKIDDEWEIAFNGHDEATASSLSSVPVPPMSVYIQYNGWPAGVVGFLGGVIAASEGANEETFLAAIEAAIKRSAH